MTVRTIIQIMIGGQYMPTIAVGVEQEELLLELIESLITPLMAGEANINIHLILTILVEGNLMRTGLLILL